MGNNKQKIVIGVMVILVIFIGGTLGVKYSNKLNKSEDSLNQAMLYLEENKYDDSIVELKKSVELNSGNKKAVNMLEVVKQLKELDNIYANKDYVQVKELITKIYSIEGSDVVKAKLEVISKDIEEKLGIMTEIDSLNMKIEDLISKKSYQEAIDIINSYLEENLNDAYKVKLNALTETVNKAKSAYDDEQKKIAEEKKKQEELQAASSTINNENEAEARIKELAEIKAYINKNVKLYFMSNKEIFDGLGWGQPELHGMKGYNVEVRSQSPDPLVTSAVGFYFVEAKTKNVYKMEIAKGQYFLVK